MIETKHLQYMYEDDKTVPIYIDALTHELHNKNGHSCGIKIYFTNEQYGKD